MDEIKENIIKDEDLKGADGGVTPGGKILKVIKKHVEKYTETGKEKMINDIEI